MELLAVERATAAEREHDAVMVHLVGTEATLHKSLEAMEMVWKA